MQQLIAYRRPLKSLRVASVSKDLDPGAEMLNPSTMTSLDDNLCCMHRGIVHAEAETEVIRAH